MNIGLPLILGLALAQAPNQTPNEPVRVGGSIKEPKKLKTENPSYPEEARRAGLRGNVVLECLVDTKGIVADVRVVSGVPPLTDAATRAVKKWRYTPLLSNGSPLPFIVTVTIVFGGQIELRTSDLLRSLTNKNEYIRAAAVFWLGRAQLSGDDLLRVSHRLKALAEHDDSERVRAAAVGAIAMLEAK